ncbi:hypothetical protein PILCRDRAFT_83238 [Piloderma croceum F 1598]|uniref:Transposase Tc1-like domain-containing protein n=1 Tax=Piloderma croceum (strain F 1598) TaxID=765440 RepID=A0A0C3GJJ2_PILCF|nr:hypothetical protein PILCRDRAFT_83238 [Piloderma croceum F 1598]
MSVEYTPSKHGRVLQLRDLNYSYREIEKITGVSKTTAQETVKCDKNHHTRKSLPRSGHPSTITTHNHRQVIHELKQHQFEPYKTIAERSHDLTEQQVHTITHDAGFHCCIAVCKPFLTEAAIEKRVKWADENDGCNWETVIWTDESTIELRKRPVHLHVTRHPGEEYLPECIQLTFHSGRQSLMVWAAIAHGRKGPLI